MKKIILTLYVFLLNITVFSQSKSDLKFIPLLAYDTISNAKEIEKIKKENEFQEVDFFIKDWVDKTNTLRKSFFYKKGTFYIIYELPSPYEGSGSFSSYELSNNNRFITYFTDYHYGSKGHSEGSGDFHIIDLKNLTFVSIKTYLTTEDWEDEKPVVISKCKSEINLKSNILLANRKCTKDLSYKESFGENCIPSGKYKISNGKLIEIKASQ
nr:hypothetical protein [uncultured Flavobacterium sp.]